jgi:hypothetical protein
MINTKLQSIIDTKSAIGNAIVNKGGTITSETPFFNYASEIDNISTGSVLTGNATANQVFNGQTFYSNDANTQLTGTFTFNGNATTSDVGTGKTFYATNGTILTGTASLAPTFRLGQIVTNLSSNIATFNTTLVNDGGGFSFVSDNNFVYVGGSGSAVRKYHKDNLSLVATSPSAGASVEGLILKDGFIYGSAYRNTVKYYTSNLAVVASSFTGAYEPTKPIGMGFIGSNLYMYHPVSSSSRGSVFRRNENTLSILNVTNIGVPPFNYSEFGQSTLAKMIVNDNKIYFLGFNNSTGYQLQITNESYSNIARTTVTDGTNPMMFGLYQNSLYIATMPTGSFGSRVRRYNSSTLSLTNEISWPSTFFNFNSPSAALSLLNTSGNNLIFSSVGPNNTYMYVLNADLNQSPIIFATTNLGDSGWRFYADEKYIYMQNGASVIRAYSKDL